MAIGTVARVGKGAKDLLVGCGVLLAGFTLLMVAAMVLIPRPESIDVDPLEEVVGDLDVLKEPEQHCPESADACWGSVVVASGESRSATIDRATRNAVAAGYVRIGDPAGPWAAERGEVCLQLYEPEKLQVYEAAEFPADAMYIGIKRC
jgi:hypothetical protein